MPGQGGISKEVVLITKYFLPNLNVDSDSVYSMIKGLLAQDPTLKISVVTTESKYKGDFTNAEKYSLELLRVVKVIKVRSLWSNPQSSVLKLVSGFLEGYRLVATAKRLKVSNIISLSNPPLISFWHSLLLSRRNFFYWTFDVFPEALVADEKLSKNNIFYKLLSKITYLNAPDSLIALGNYQYDFLLAHYKERINRIILPCGIHDEQLQHEKPSSFAKGSNVMTIGYLGNLGRAHSLSFLKNVITAVANRPSFQLVLSIYGFHKQTLLSHINSTKSNNILLIDFIDKSELGIIDIHLVSLKESWNNISVPSKAVSAVCAGSALWYCGSAHVDTAEMFRECSYYSSDDLEEIYNVLDNVSGEDILAKKRAAFRVKDKLLAQEVDAYSSIIKLLE